MPGFQPGTTFGNVEPVRSTYPGLNEELVQRFPNGVSQHGARYLATWPGQEHPTFAVEAILEAVRLGGFADRPSRMTSNFAFETVDDARAFAIGYRSAFYADIWRVEGDVLHRGNMGLLSKLEVPVTAMLERAAAYWKGEQGPALQLWELLVGPGMRLVEVVETTGVEVPTMLGVGEPLLA
jgi:hypothetical protein